MTTPLPLASVPVALFFDLFLTFLYLMRGRSDALTEVIRPFSFFGR